MHVLFEEDGAFKAATILADNDSSLQVETASGKRSKIKAANVLLALRRTGADALARAGRGLAAGIEQEFLWECVGDGEFSFADFANEYFGHVATAVEAAALLLALHSAPVYFHRKGKGRFPQGSRRHSPGRSGRSREEAPASTDHRAHGRRTQGLHAAARVPADARPVALQARPQSRRDQGAGSGVQRNGPVGAAPAAEVWRHPLGARLPPAALPVRTVSRAARTFRPRAATFAEQPAARRRAAFSIDDATTTEIDDAFSLQTLPGLGWQVGIHIAAPALGIAPGSPLDAIARERLSTVYLPGSKITMLPDKVVERFTLASGRDCAGHFAVPDGDARVRNHGPRVAHRDRSGGRQPAPSRPRTAVQRADDRRRPAEFAFRDELMTLWQLANACEGRRGKPSAMQGNHDYNFRIEATSAMPTPVASRSARADAAARSTSWSPN
jgi:exoribonuclease-2